MIAKRNIKYSFILLFVTLSMNWQCNSSTAEAQASLMAGMASIVAGSTTTDTKPVSPSSAKDINAFRMNSAGNTALSHDVVGVISGTDITITLPTGTDVTALTASITTTGVSITVGGVNQINDITTNDYSTVVIFTVAAQDGSTKDYSVTAVLAPDSAKEITGFGFTNADNPGLPSDIAGVITGTDIVATVPFGTDVTALVASFVFIGDTVTIGSTSQVSGTTANDFTSTVTFTVTAQDGSTINFNVTVTVQAPATTNDISLFSFDSSNNAGFQQNFAGTIIGTDISVTVPYNANLTGLVATFIHDGVSVAVGGIQQASGTTTNDYSSPVIFTVTAQNGSVKSYTVTVTQAAAPDISAFSFNSANNPGLPSDIAGVITGTDITATVPFGTDVTALVATFTLTGGTAVKVGATAQTSGTTANDFTSAVTYTVTAPDQSTQDFIVTVIVDAAPNPDVQVTIDFDSLPAGAVLSNQYAADVTFSNNVAGTDVYVYALAATYGTSPANIICGTASCNSHVYLDFTYPANNLQFYAVGVSSNGVSGADINVYQNTTLLATEQIIGAGTDFVPLLIDLSAYSDVTRIEILNITDFLGIGFDDFSFTHVAP